MQPDPSKQPGIRVDGMFVQSAQFSHADGFLDLPADTRFNGGLQIGASHALRADGKAARITLAASTDPQQQQPYKFEVVVVAQISELEGLQNLPIKDFISSAASISLVYPFLRQTVAEITRGGRFGPVWLNVINPQLLVAPEAQPGVVAPEPEPGALEPQNPEEAAEPHPSWPTGPPVGGRRPARTRR